MNSLIVNAHYGGGAVFSTAGVFGTTATPAFNQYTSPAWVEGAAVDLSKSPALVSLFYLLTIDDVTTPTATFGGQPCLVYRQDFNTANGIYAGNQTRMVVTVICLPPVGTVFSGNQFVLTFGSGLSAMAQQRPPVTAILYYVDQTATALNAFVGKNVSNEGAPNVLSVTLPAIVPVNVNDIVFSTWAYARSGGTTAAPTLSGGRSITNDMLDTGGGGIWGVGIRVATAAAESDVVTWTLSAADTNELLWASANVLSSLATACDANWNNTVLLLRFDDTLGTSTFTDSSQYNHTMTAVGTTAIPVVANTFLNFGSGIGSFSSNTTSNAGYVKVPITAGAELDILSDASGDFTIEGWFLLNAFSGADAVLFNYGDDLVTFAGASGLELICHGSAGGAFKVQPTIPAWPTISGTYSSAANTWHHFAVVRVSGQGRLFLDGALIGTANGWSGYAGPPVGSAAAFGWTAVLTGPLQTFYLDEVRVTKGLARYLAAFSPPITPFGGTCAALLATLNLSTKFVAGQAFKPVLTFNADGIFPQVYFPPESVTAVISPRKGS